MARLIPVFPPDAVSASWPRAFVYEGSFLSLLPMNGFRADSWLRRFSNRCGLSGFADSFMFPVVGSMKGSAGLLGGWQGPDSFAFRKFQDSVTGKSTLGRQRPSSLGSTVTPWPGWIISK